MENKNKKKFSLLKNEVLDITAEEAPPPQDSRLEVVGLITESRRRRRTTQISKENKK